MKVSPEELAEIFQLVADEYQAQEGFRDWSEETERKARQRGWPAVNKSCAQARYQK
jgi:hypothetical protein